jgi:hypothetical protein
VALGQSQLEQLNVQYGSGTWKIGVTYNVRHKPGTMKIQVTYIIP